jgi:uncharacterized protein (DUF433 family)
VGLSFSSFFFLLSSFFFPSNDTQLGTRLLPLTDRLHIVEIIRNSMNLDRLNRVALEAGQCGGRHCIRGHRIRVPDVLELLAAGASFEEILADYPFLEREDIFASPDYAAHQTDHAVLPAS